MIRVKYSIVALALGSICGLEGIGTANALEVKVYAELPEGRMIQLPSDSFLFREQEIKLGVRTKSKGLVTIRYFEGDTEVEKFSRSLETFEEDHFFPSSHKSWRLTGEPGLRRFEVSLKTDHGEVERTNWSGELVIGKQLSSVNSRTNSKFESIDIPNILKRALTQQLSNPVESLDSIRTRGGSDGALVYKRTANSIVKVLFENGHGSGVVVSGEGIIVTNFHVVEDTSNGYVLIKPNGSIRQPIYQFEIIRTYPLQDLAFIKIHFDSENSILPVKLADLKTIDVGDTVYAIGHPKGFDWTLTSGILSAKRNSHPFGSYKGMEQRADLLQTQTPISSGNSGGALLNRNSELIGINTFVRKKAQNLNFAVAVSEVREKLAKLKLVGKRKSISDPSLAPDNGKLVRQVDSNDNGHHEIVAYDTSGNGLEDYRLIDIDDDGNIDSADVDQNGDSFFETKYRFQRQGNSWNKVMMIDRDADGRPDILFFDQHADGSWDSVRNLN